MISYILITVAHVIDLAILYCTLCIKKLSSWIPSSAHIFRERKSLVQPLSLRYVQMYGAGVVLHVGGDGRLKRRTCSNFVHDRAYHTRVEGWRGVRKDSALLCIWRSSLEIAHPDNSPLSNFCDT
jgi:hypothetical protein